MNAQLLYYMDTVNALKAQRRRASLREDAALRYIRRLVKLQGKLDDVIDLWENEIALSRKAERSRESFFKLVGLFK